MKTICVFSGASVGFESASPSSKPYFVVLRDGMRSTVQISTCEVSSGSLSEEFMEDLVFWWSRHFDEINDGWLATQNGDMPKPIDTPEQTAKKMPKKPWSIKSLLVQEPYVLRVAFEDGLAGEIDFSGSGFVGVSEKLKDFEFFKKARIDRFGNIVWSKDLDLSPRTAHKFISENGVWKIA